MMLSFPENQKNPLLPLGCKRVLDIQNNLEKFFKKQDLSQNAVSQFTSFHRS